MKKCALILGWLFLMVSLPSPALWRAVTDSYAQKLLGGVEVKDKGTKGLLPQRVPETIYIADFALEAGNYATDQGVRGALPGRLGQRLPHPLAKDDSATRARQIIETMAESLVQGLKEKGLHAVRLRKTDGNLPGEGWLVQGIFTEVGEGNRIKRAAIGFGRGATSMDLQLGISDLTSLDPYAAFAIFGTVKEPNKIPGAVVTKNPYVAAAKFLVEKNATERDIRRTAAEVVEHILKFQKQIREKASLGGR